MKLYKVPLEDPDNADMLDFKHLTKAGGSRTLAVTKHVPEAWSNVALDSWTIDDETVVIRVRKVS